MEDSLYVLFIEEECKADASHDITHIIRVVKNARDLLKHESADADVVTAAAWLHDCVTLPKNHPDRKRVSQLAAVKAAEFLKNTVFPYGKIDEVVHAIEAHSFSAGIEAKTREAQIVQDADRLDALGAIGIARCFMVGGSLNRKLYHAADPFCEDREKDESQYTIDHFFTKLLRLPDMMNTETGKLLAAKRVKYMQEFLNTLKGEVLIYETEQ